MPEPGKMTIIEIPLLSWRLRLRSGETMFANRFSTYLLLCIVLMLATCMSSSAQTYKQYVKLGDKSFKEQDYYGARVYYAKAVEKDSSKMHGFRKMADAYRLQLDYLNAEYWYQHVVDSDLKKQYTRELFWLATMKKNNGKYKDAKKNFTTFRKRFKKASDPIYRKARQEIKSCVFALENQQDSAKVTVKNMGQPLNTYNAEFAPVLLDDSTLFFSTLRFDSLKSDNSVMGSRNFTRIFRAMLKDGVWQSPMELDTVINNPRINAANGSFSSDSSRFYFSKCPPNLNCAIYETRLKNGAWQRPKKLNSAINNEGFNTTQPCIALIDDQEYLFYVTDRLGGRGGLDIWYIPYTNGEKQVRARNMGARINTIEDDICPYYDPSTETFYFSSTWHLGYGGMDIFKAVGTNPRRMSKAENMGKPINSPANDMYFSYNSERNLGFLTSNRVGSFSLQGETCCNDIYEVKYPQPETIKVDTPPPPITLKQLQDYLPITLYFHNDRPNPRTLDTTTTLTYLDTYDEFIGLEEEYILALTEGIKDEEEVIKIEEEVLGFFSELLDEGAEKLEIVAKNLIKELEQGQQIELTVKGYASPLAKSDYNLNLTLRRIKSLENYLESYNSGIYRPYLNGTAENGGRLTITRIPFGEERAATAVSDKLVDKKASVYSRAAALERKIEILGIAKTDTKVVPPAEEEIEDATE